MKSRSQDVRKLTALRNAYALCSVRKTQEPSLYRANLVPILFQRGVQSVRKVVVYYGWKVGQPHKQ